MQGGWERVRRDGECIVDPPVHDAFLYGCTVSGPQEGENSLLLLLRTEEGCPFALRAGDVRLLRFDAWEKHNIVSEITWRALCDEDRDMIAWLLHAEGESSSPAVMKFHEALRGRNLLIISSSMGCAGAVVFAGHLVFAPTPSLAAQIAALSTD